MGLFREKRNGSWRAARGYAIALGAVLPVLCAIAHAQEVPVRGCHIEAVEFEGWHAQQVSNAWVNLVLVPQLGGRVMQVSFEGHPYLFVNPKFKGQYFPPLPPVAKQRWFNYGGDKIWPMPEGDQDEHHWSGPISDPLDDGSDAFQVSYQVRSDLADDPSFRLRWKMKFGWIRRRGGLR
jgi:hypothetical protein